MYKSTDKYNQNVTFTSNGIIVNGHSHIKHTSIVASMLNLLLQCLAVAIIIFVIYMIVF